MRSEIDRLAEFGKDRPDPSGGMERGLTAAEIKTYMKANLLRAKDTERWYYPILMQGEWPVLLRIMGKGEGEQRYSAWPRSGRCSSSGGCPNGSRRG